MLVSVLLTLLACDDQAASPPEHTSPPSPSPPVTVEVAAAATVAPPTAPDGRPFTDGAPFHEQWLVILASTREPGERPAALNVLAAHPELAVEPVWLQSGQLKGLMPCYDILVAGGWGSLDAAQAQASALKIAGVDNYVKNAGSYIGDDRRVIDYCSGDSPAMDRCQSPARFVGSLEGRAILHLDLDPVPTEAVLSGAPAVHPRDKAHTQWSSTLSAQRVEDWSIGDEVLVLLTDRAEQRSCHITGFAALVEGQPHFGWAENGDHARPGCGDEEVVATLDCELDPTAAAAALAVPPGAAFALATPSPLSLAGVHRSVMARDASYAALQAQATAAAAEQDAALQVEEAATLWSAAGARISMTNTTWTTGEGFSFCGGEDLRMSAMLLMDERGAAPIPLGPAIETSLSKLLGVVRLGEHWIVVAQEPFGGRMLIEAGAVVCEQDYAYCDCPC